MRFYLLLAVINVGCFLPLYLLNLRTAPNPFPLREFLTAEKSRWTWLPSRLYMRMGSPDPFRIHFDFTVFVLLAAASSANGPIARFLAALLLAVGFVEILYTSVMYSVFKRPPALRSDLSLLRIGFGLARPHTSWMIALAVMALTMVWLTSVAAVTALFETGAPNPWAALLVAGSLVPPCIYHCTIYSAYLWRGVYSTGLHSWLNLRFERQVRRLASRDVAYYQRLNDFGRVTFREAPNVVVVCVESYGSVAHRDGRHGAGLQKLLLRHEHQLIGEGYRFASTLSEAPLFAGGSWLSLASFSYGMSIDSVQLYELLFSRPSNFDAYESLFHALRRNGYENLLLCPLGGAEPGTVDWKAVDRLFQPRIRIGFDDLEYAGPTQTYFAFTRLYAALDQYSLNFGYERALELRRPFSLFFCTLNSHYPWHSAAQAVDDWRTLNAPTSLEQLSHRPPIERYNAAIHYQLDYIFRFVADRSADSPLVIIFGDHQPPMITPDHMGKQTPIHVLSRDQALVDVFIEHGFVPTLDLTNEHPRPMRHEGFLSLLMKAMQSAYGTEPGLVVPYRELGARIMEGEPAAR